MGKSSHSTLGINQESSRQVMGVVDADAGSFQITVLAALISDSKKKEFCSRQTWHLSGLQDLFPCLSLRRQSCLKGADWENNESVCSARSHCALNTSSLQRFPKFPKFVNQD